MQKKQCSKWLFKTLLFNLSLIPLYVILIIEYSNWDFIFNVLSKQEIKTETSILICQAVKNNILAISLLLLILIGFLGLFQFQKNSRYNREDPKQFNEIESKDFDHLTFLSTYIIPLITFKLDDLKSFVSLFVLITIIGLIYIKSNCYYLNPVLLLFGYKIYKAKTENKNVVLISKGSIELSSITSRYINLGSNIYYIKDQNAST